MLSLVLLLGQAMPDQGWVVRNDQGDWRLVASGWALVWRAWPLMLLGAVVGFVGAWGVLAWLLTGAAVRRAGSAGIRGPPTGGRP